MLEVKQSIPETDVNRQYFVAAAEAKLDAKGPTASLVDYSKADADAKALLAQMAAAPAPDPSKRSCPFFLKGECKRGNACPYRHQMPADADGGGPARRKHHHNNNIKDRFISFVFDY